MHLTVYYKCSHCKYNIFFGNEGNINAFIQFDYKNKRKNYEAQIA